MTGSSERDRGDGLRAVTTALQFIGLAAAAAFAASLAVAWLFPRSEYAATSVASVSLILLPLVPMALGAVRLVQISRSGGRLKGRTRAVIHILLGALILCFLVGFVVLSVFMHAAVEM